MNSHPIDDAIRDLRAGLDAWWDAGDGMDDAHVMSLPPGKFVMAAHAFDQDVLCWLTYFVARRALPCWELSCNDSRPRIVVGALGRHLCRGAAVDWADVVQATPSPYSDCTYSETQSASDAAAEAARYIHERDPRYAIYCISSADVAYDHVLTEDRFRQWLVDVAIPVALEKREMTDDEQEALRYRPEPAPLLLDTRRCVKRKSPWAQRCLRGLLDFLGITSDRRRAREFESESKR